MSLSYFLEISRKVSIASLSGCEILQISLKKLIRIDLKEMWLSFAYGIHFPWASSWLSPRFSIPF